MADKEVSAEFAELMVELMKLSKEEAMYWQARMRSLAESGRVKVGSWAPADKKQWGNHAKVVDEFGETAGFIDLTDGRRLNPVEGDGARPVAPKSSETGDDLAMSVASLPEQVLGHRTESVEQRQERLGDDEFAWEHAREADDEFASYLQDPAFARLVEQENLVMDDEGRWEVGDGAEFLAEYRGQVLDRDDAYDFATRAGWEWDGVPGARPELPHAEGAVEFETGRDGLVRAGEDAWVVVRESADEHQLPVGEVVTDGQARVIAEEHLGWQWVDEPGEQIIGDRPVVVSETRVQEPAGGTAVLLADRWAWADGAGDSAQEREDVQRIEGAWSVWGETEFTRGATVPVGTVAPEGWDVDAEREREQQYHLFVEQSDSSSPDWER
ncbi:hypothetical protein [Rothia sp. P4278]|uniref:hypothetical protein n=1 Tax=Rothia sp. P4278 TaxID=3402658 RepID=UPI003AEC7690